MTAGRPAGSGGGPLSWVASRLRGLLAWSTVGGRAGRRAQRLSLALRTADIALWELDVESGALWWSDETGLLAAPVAGRTEGRARLAQALERVHPDDQPLVESAVVAAVSDPGVARRVRARLLEADGSVRWLEARAETWLDRAGRVRGLRGSVADVTELKAAEEGARRAEASRRVLATIAEAAATAADEDSLLARATDLLHESLFPDSCGFLVLDAEGGVLRHTGSCRSGVPPDERRPVGFGTGIAGAVAASGVARRVDDLVREPDEAALDPECLSEICVPLKVGARVLGVFVAASPRPGAFTNADERLLGVLASQVASALDRVRSEEALRQSGELYRAYFTSSPIALFVSDARGRYLEVNGAACALTGYAREELVRMSIGDLLSGDDGHAVAERLVGLLALGAGRSEIRIRRRDGSVRHCLVHATPIGADRLLGLLLDVTEGREAEEKLRESEERFRSLSEAGFEAILVHDGGRIEDANQALCDMGGYSWHEIVERDAFELVAPEHRELAYRNMLADDGRPYEIDVVRRDGTRLPVEVQGRSFPYRGRVQRVLSIRDISARKKAERVRESLIRELEAKNVELERFGYTVTHDLKAPLVTIRGFADYVERDAREGRTDRLAEDARRIAEGVGKLQRLLDELFDLSRAGRPVGPPVAVPAAELVQEALRLLAGERSELRECVQIAGPLPVVFGDRARLVRVFQNLLDNAMKFAAGAAEPLVTVEARPPVDGKAVLVVRDNGIGIEPRHRDRVFDLFEKLDPRAEGSGVGLPVVRRVVESHGGRVWLESEGRGAGTAACVTLPLAGPAVETELTAATGRRRG